MSDPLAPRLVERVLGRLGFGARPSVDRDGLERIYAAWCRSVPFDNVQKRIALVEGREGPLPGDDPADFFETWLDAGTGGTCWSGNGALCELLLALGFEAQRGIATMLVAPGVPPNHGTVCVDLDAERLLVDASMLFVEPLLLEPGAVTRAGADAWGAEARQEEGATLIRFHPLQSGPLDCRIESFGAEASEFSRCHEKTRSWSPFNFQLSARIQREDGPIGVAFGEVAGISSAEGRWQRPFEPGERKRFLVETLGIRESTAERLPPDEAMPPPPGAPTAEEW
ncbi:MAG: arylamine N-acetyltransferase [Myxococcales bacterium]|nr:arylamine N-acetyltransferase [Myxococcales bacterium]